jgi:hypothetical protein
VTAEEIEALIEKHGSQTAAAQALGVSRTAFRRLRARACGICRYCSSPAGTASLCPRCAVGNRRRAAAHRARASRERRCLRCNAPEPSGQAYCSTCAVLNRANVMRHRQARLAAGLCTHCGEAALTQQCTCAECAAQHRRKTAARIAHRRAAGLCTACGSSARIPGRKWCARCFKRDRQRRSRRDKE